MERTSYFTFMRSYLHIHTRLLYLYVHRIFCNTATLLKRLTQRSNKKNERLYKRSTLLIHLAVRLDVKFLFQSGYLWKLLMQIDEY